MRGVSATAARKVANGAPIDVPISLARAYGETWMGEATVIDAPFIEPEDPIRESYADPIPIRHVVRVDGIEFDDEAWPMNGVSSRFPIGAAMPSGTMDTMDDYRLVFDGSHA